MYKYIIFGVVLSILLGLIYYRITKSPGTGSSRENAPTEGVNLDSSTSEGVNLDSIPECSIDIDKLMDLAKSRGMSEFTYNDRHAMRKAIEEFLRNEENLSITAQLRDRVEDLALENVQTNLGISSPNSLLGDIHNAGLSPASVTDSVQAILRGFAVNANSQLPNSPLIRSPLGQLPPDLPTTALIPYNSITDLVVYSPNTIPIPSSTIISRYNLLIHYLDHYTSIMASHNIYYETYTSILSTTPT